MSNVTETILDIKRVRKSYKIGRKNVPVLKGMDLKILQGECVLLLGPSGSGKSTLLHIAGGLDKPDEGHVIIGKENIYQLTDRKRAHIRNSKVGFVFQFYNLLPDLNAFDNIILPAILEKHDKMRSKKEVENRAFYLLELIGLVDRASHKPSELSGGEQQRVATARALINEPELILADEPTGNLDREAGDSVMELLFNLNEKNGTTLLIVSHNPQLSGLRGRILSLDNGIIEHI
ncbi:MAG: ABC transporter ATP-binding protein [Candidatus Theseobacter exili]|nr:ABC transporter ATP-binding protein [Candidatus Theseobacter exili]